MTKTIEKCGQNFEDYLDDLVGNGDSVLDTKKFTKRNKSKLFYLKNYYLFYCSRYFGSYSLDVISSCCFGIDTNSIKDPNNEFVKHLSQFTNRNFKETIKVILLSELKYLKSCLFASYDSQLKCKKKAFFQQ
jgi:Sec7-like guanine-nucleotide exchange factor